VSADSNHPLHPHSPIDETHDPERRSWVEAANEPGADFPIQNLPFGVFRRTRDEGWPRVGIAIGDRILDVTAALDEDLLEGTAAEACDAPSMNPLLALTPEDWRDLRRQVSALLHRDGSVVPSEEVRSRITVPMADCELLLPMEVGDFTDFYASIHHATNVGSMFRPDNPLLPNYRWIPIGYHGRASSVVVSGTPVRRPVGQRKPEEEGGTPSVGPSRLLDYELEVGIVVGGGNALGSSIPLADAERHLFGLCLLNDWSARDLQAWEYQPLGPFLAKSFASTVSPWIVTRDALAPFRIPAFTRPEGDPDPLPHLLDQADRRAGGFDLTLEVHLRTPTMQEADQDSFVVSRGSFRDMYWTPAQMIAHHASNGCNLRPGDLLGSGTVSGAEPGSRGCMLERTWRGTEPLELAGGETRKFLEDGDEVILRGWCRREGRVPIGFGSCVGTVVGDG